jgi:hypothetical protein
MSRKVRWANANTVTFYEEFPEGRSNARLFHRQADGWHPPLPSDVAAELPVERSRSISRSALSRLNSALPASSTPYWQLREPGSWRLRR